MGTQRPSGDASPGRNVPFGALLRRLRESAALTQEELAGRSGLTANGIGALERGERKRPYPHTVNALAGALGLSDQQRASLLAAVPSRDVGGPDPVLALPTPPTPLVGREREVGEIEALLGRAVRLLTLTGTGGVGKTRLALQAARQTTHLFPGGAIFAALAPLDDASLVLSTVARTLGPREGEGLSPREALEVRLRDKRLLLVLDNFEHVLEAAPDVGWLLEACPGISVLVTSRAPLRVRGEQEYPVSPLTLPASTLSPDAEQVLGSPAGRLFVERARAASPGFRLVDANAAAVAAICWRLAGLPLALEIAAARTRFLDPAALLERLDRVLSSGWARDLPGRQRTMRATLDWSHGLLGGEEQVLFRRLAVFAGGFDLEGAEAVGASPGDLDPEDAFDSLGRLVEQSLVTVTPPSGGSAARYGLLEPVRRYALEKLEESGEVEAVRDAHAAFFLTFAQRTAPGSEGHDQASWLRRLEAELDNLRAALRWSIDRARIEAVSDAAWSSWTFWWLRGHAEEGRGWVEEALARGTDAPARVRARLLYVASMLAQGLYDWEPARLMAEEGLALFRELGDERGVHLSLGTLGFVALGQGRHETAGALLEEAVDLGLRVGARRSSAMMLGSAAAVPLGSGDLAGARRLAERALSLAREVGPTDGVYVALHTLATVALVEGDRERATTLFKEGLSLSSEVGDNSNVAYFLEGLAAVAASGAAAKDDLARAARLWGAAEAIAGSTEVLAYTYALDRSLHRRHLADARARLGEGSWTQAQLEGRAMTAEQAVAEALSKDD